MTDVIWWQVYPLGFVGAPIRTPETGVHHRLSTLLGWLDYAVRLGASGLLLGPVFASSSHGYDTVDYLRIDPRLGDDSDFDALVAGCRQRGLRVMLDGVFNHVGRDHPLFRTAVADGPQGRLAGMFRLDWASDGSVRHGDFEGHADLVAFNHNDDRVVDLVVEVMCHWLARGVDGWRLDAAYAVDPAFWARVLPRVRDQFPEAVFVGEVIHGDYPAIVAASGMDSLTQYELWKATWSALADRNFFELSWNLQRHNEFLDTFMPMTFIGNHDVTRIATRVGPQAAVLALTVLATVGGMPSIYSGDEQAFTATKLDQIGGDDPVRPAFPSGPQDLFAGGAWMFTEHQRLLGLRRRHRWLVTARTVNLELSNERYRYQSVGPDGQSLTVHLDLDPAPSARVWQADDLVYSFG